MPLCASSRSTGTCVAAPSSAFGKGRYSPLSRIYHVRLTYYPRLFFDGWRIDASYVSIHVLDPPIGALARKAGRRLPHVYRNHHDPDLPALCVYDPEADEWDPSMFLVDTIIPWTSDWLFFFEGWEIDGVFGGRGRHPEPPSVPCQTKPTLETVAPSASAAFHSFGQRGRRFRILSIDGGGIRGIFPAAVLAGLEAQYTSGRPISDFFDLVAGTSTGGIIALGLGAGYSAADMLALYVDRGGEIFPPFPQTRLGRVRAGLAGLKTFVRYRYDRVRATADLRGETRFTQNRGLSTAPLYSFY